WMLADVSLHAIAVEARADRSARIHRNAAAFGVPGLRVIEGRAPAALADLPTPNAIFIGGGAGDPGVLDAAIAALASGGRLVANRVPLAPEAFLPRPHAPHGADLVAIALPPAGALGERAGWRAPIPVTQGFWSKP